MAERIRRCLSGAQLLFNGRERLRAVMNFFHRSRNAPATFWRCDRDFTDKLRELEELDIIEKVDTPSDWVFPVVVVPKANGDIRLCVDMRRANEAVVREHYQVPVLDEVLQDLNQSKVFTKLDIKWAYHQIELEPNSREITTFMTHQGMYRYKRLNFGISCAPEMYNKIIQQIFQDLPGVRSIYDDVIVYGSTKQEHDQNLLNVLNLLREKGTHIEQREVSVQYEVYAVHGTCTVRRRDFAGSVQSEGLARDARTAIRC